MTVLLVEEEGRNLSFLGLAIAAALEWPRAGEFCTEAGSCSSQRRERNLVLSSWSWPCPGELLTSSGASLVGGGAFRLIFRDDFFIFVDDVGAKCVVSESEAVAFGPPRPFAQKESGAPACV